MNLQNPNLSFKGKKIHFIGIGGIGMSALARYFKAHGSIISGSDKDTSSLIKELENEDITSIWTPHNLENIKTVNPEYVIYSTAVTTDNSELAWAKENKKTVIHRSELLEYATKTKKLIAISGTHGKTTTSAMICEMLTENKLDPSCIIGGILLSKNTNTIIGNGNYFVIEADESDKSFLRGDPFIGIITNIEPDHLENYPGGIEEIKKSFLEFAKKSASNKGLIACIQDKITKELITKNFNLNNSEILTYGINPYCNNARLEGKYNIQDKAWDIFLDGKHQTSIKLRIPGEHNILNALGVFGTGHLLGIKPEKIKNSLERYQGVKRRFQTLINTEEITIIDDYAHHPTEIAASIKAAKELNPKRLLIIMQPHQPIRLKDLWDEFLKVIKQETELLFITDAYIARGREIEGISSKRLVKEANKPNIKYVPGDIKQIADYLRKEIKYGDLILILGAGDITNLGLKLLQSNHILASNSGNN